jgi:hypothetical protein
LSKGSRSAGIPSYELRLHRRLVLIVFGMLVALVSSKIVAQTARPPESPVFQSDFGACAQAVTPQEEHQLVSKRDIAQKNIATLDQKLKRSAADGSNKAADLQSQIRQQQVALVQTLERLECKQLSETQDPVVRGPSAPSPNFIEMKVNYATDRTVVQNSPEPEKHFSGTLDPNFVDFSFGQARITIPTRRQPGELNLPEFWNFVNRPDPNRYFVLRDLTSLTRDAFMSEINGGSEG